MKRTRFHLLLCFVIVGLCLVAACAWWFRADTRQQRLDAQLFAAIAQDNTPAVVSLLEQDADPNAQNEVRVKSPSFLQWIREKVLFRRAEQSGPKEVTSAFDAALFQPDVANPDIVLATALLEHGANLTNPYGTISVATNSYAGNMPPSVAFLEMPVGGTSRQIITGVPLPSLIQLYRFQGTPQLIDAFVQAAVKAGAKPEKRL